MKHLGGRGPITSAQRWLSWPHRLSPLHSHPTATLRYQEAPDDRIATEALTPNSLHVFPELLLQSSYLSSNLLPCTSPELLGSPGCPSSWTLLSYTLQSYLSWHLRIAFPSNIAFTKLFQNETLEGSFQDWFPRQQPNMEQTLCSQDRLFSSLYDGPMMKKRLKELTPEKQTWSPSLPPFNLYLNDFT